MDHRIFSSCQSSDIIYSYHMNAIMQIEVIAFVGVGHGNTSVLSNMAGWQFFGWEKSLVYHRH